MNKPKQYDNAKVSHFLGGFYHSSQLCEEYPQIDNIFSGVLELRTAGDTATRALSRQTLFHVLQWCPVIDVEAINEVTNRQYAYPTLTRYAALARVASKALGRFIEQLPTEGRATTVKQAQQALDAPYLAELEAMGLL
mgnify:CR=1 FL=1